MIKINMKHSRVIIIIIIIIFMIFTAGYSGSGKRNIDFSSIDALFKKGLIEYHNKSINKTVKESLDLCLRLEKDYPDDYDVLWRCARSAGVYAESLLGLNDDGWEDKCAAWGKKGETLALRAQGLKPARVEAYLWQTSCTGMYGFAAGIFTAVREGIHNKIRACMERAYARDKSYQDYIVVLSLSLYYFNLPWPLRDREKALGFYREFISSAKDPWLMKTRQVEIAEGLLGLDDDSYRKTARQHLNEALAVEKLPKYYRDKAVKLLLEME